MAEKNMKKLVVNGTEYVLVDGGGRALIATANNKITTLESDLGTLDTKVDNLPSVKSYQLNDTYVEAEEKLTINLTEV